MNRKKHSSKPDNASKCRNSWQSFIKQYESLRDFVLKMFLIVLVLILFWFFPIKIYLHHVKFNHEIYNAMQKIGDYLVGVAAIFTALTGIPEWRRRRKIGQYERADTALVVCLRFIKAILHVSSPLSEYTEAERQLPAQQRLWEDRQRRYKNVADDLTRFWDVIDSANLYFSDEMISKVERLWDIWVEIETSFQTYISSGGPSTGAALSDMFSKGFGIPYRDELMQIQQDIKDEMKKLRDLVK